MFTPAIARAIIRAMMACGYSHPGMFMQYAEWEATQIAHLVVGGRHAEQWVRLNRANILSALGNTTMELQVAQAAIAAVKAVQ